MENKNGYVYVLTNEAMPHLVKIGMTQRDDIFLRGFFFAEKTAPEKTLCFTLRKKSAQKLLR